MNILKKICTGNFRPYFHIYNGPFLSIIIIIIIIIVKRLSFIVRVNVVLNRTVVVDSD